MRMVCHGLNSPRKPKCPEKHYCASNEQQAEISDGIARNLACAGLSVTCADIKSVRAARRWYFHRQNKDLPITPNATRSFQCVHLGAQRNCSQTNARLPEMPGWPTKSAGHASAIDPNGSKVA